MSIRAFLVKRQLRKLFNTAGQRERGSQPRDGDSKVDFLEGLDKLTGGQRGLSEKKGVLVDPVMGAPFAADFVSLPKCGEDRAILFLHGGGYMWGQARHFHDPALRLSKHTNAKVLVLDYSLSPEHQYPTQLNEAMQAYKYLLSAGRKGRDISIIGDSAGGNLTMALCQEIAATLTEDEQPASAVLFSPWLDMTGSGNSTHALADKDIMLTPDGIGFAGQIFAGDIPLDDPRVSPLFGDLSKLPPLHIQASTHEILLDDSVRLDEGVKQAGGTSDLVIWSGLWHDFQQAAALVPEARRAIRMAGDFMLDQWDCASHHGR